MSVRLAYCAGLIDGEGSVGIYWRTKPSGNKSPEPRIQCAMTDFDAVIFLHDTFGVGRLEQRKKQAAHHKQQLRWTVDHRGAYEVAKALLPFCITKRNGLQKIVDLYEA